MPDYLCLYREVLHSCEIIQQKAWEMRYQSRATGDSRGQLRHPWSRRKSMRSFEQRILGGKCVRRSADGALVISDVHLGLHTICAGVLTYDNYFRMQVDNLISATANFAMVPNCVLHIGILEGCSCAFPRCSIELLLQEPVIYDLQHTQCFPVTTTTGWSFEAQPRLDGALRPFSLVVACILLSGLSWRAQGGCHKHPQASYVLCFFPSRRSPHIPGLTFWLNNYSSP